MTQHEYEHLQSCLRSKLISNQKHNMTNRECGFDEGIKVAMSLLHTMYEYQKYDRAQRREG